MSSDVERLERLRRRTLAGFLVVFLVWQLPSILTDLAQQDMPHWLDLSLSLVAAAGVLGFLWYAWRTVVLAQQVCERPEQAGALNDERVRRLRDRAFVNGFWALLAYVAVLHGATLLTEQLPVAALVRLGVVVGVIVPVASYLWLDRDSADAGG